MATTGPAMVRMVREERAQGTAAEVAKAPAGRGMEVQRRRAWPAAGCASGMTSLRSMVVRALLLHLDPAAVKPALVGGPSTRQRGRGVPARARRGCGGERTRACDHELRHRAASPALPSMDVATNAAVMMMPTRSMVAVAAAGGVCGVPVNGRRRLRRHLRRPAPSRSRPRYVHACAVGDARMARFAPLASPSEPTGSEPQHDRTDRAVDLQARHGAAADEWVWSATCTKWQDRRRKLVEKSREHVCATFDRYTHIEQPRYLHVHVLVSGRPTPVLRCADAEAAGA